MIEQSGMRKLDGHVERFVHSWSPLQSPSFAVGFVHGLGDHGGRFRSLAKHFASLNIASVVIDQYGNGRSGGKRGCVESYDELLAEVSRTVELAQHLWPNLPVFLYGHSMGGNLVTNYLLRNKQPQVEAAVVSAPLFHPVQPPPAWFVRIARILAKAFPNLRIGAPIKAEYLSRIENEQQAFLNDPWMHQQVSLRLGAALLDSGQWAIDHASSLSVPILLIHGEDDKICCPKASANFAQRTQRCELMTWPEMRHEPHHDLDAEIIFRIVSDWLITQAGNSQTKR